MKKRSKSVLKGGIFAVIAVLLILPVMVIAGSLEPSAAPAPTMKTLDQIPPTWSQKLTDNRFDILFGGAGVLDKETGLVWERYPSTTQYYAHAAIGHCFQLSKGGRKGWHLPTVEQLASLLDPDVSNPSLPSGHPFLTSYVQSDMYWTSTPWDSYKYLFVDFSDGFISWDDGLNENYAWCVRGGQSHDYR